MPPRKGTPGKGACPRPDSFSYVSVPHGLKNAFTAWLAGEPYWAEEAHEHRKEDPGTKPCLHWLTEGALKCPRCRQGRPVKCIGWVPLYREIDTKPVFVIVHESASDLLHGVKHPATVLVGRITEKDSVFVRRAETQLTLKSEKQTRLWPVDITLDLLQIWKLDGYADWLKGQRQEKESVSAALTDDERESSGSVPLVNNRLIAAFDAAAETAAANAKAAERNKEFVRAVAARSTNGKHHEKKEGK